MNKKKKCPICNKSVDDGLEFCPNCGEKLPTSIVCKRCGTEHLNDAPCPNCGYFKKSSNGGIIAGFIIGAVLLIGIIILIITLSGGGNNNNSTEPGGNDNPSPTNPTPAPTKENVSIKPSETKSIQYQTYSNNIFSMQIPQGWVVETMGDAIHYGIRAYKPDDQRYQIFMYLKMEPFLTNAQAKNIFSSFYAQSGDRDYAMFADSTVLKARSTLGFFESFMDHLAFINGSFGSQFYTNGTNHHFPVLYNLKVLDSMEPLYDGGGEFETILRLNFTVPLATGEVLNGQGLFTASVMPPAYIEKVGSVDVTPRLVYEISGVSSAEDDFINWEPILVQCLQSIRYTDAFIKSTQEISIAQGQAARDANAKIQNAYDSYNKAWSDRQKSYDISSQKTSDATLSYDRVKDPDTGEIYRAEVGWYDSYNTNREKYNKSNLQIVTSDNDYLEPVSGYIYK